MTRVWSLTVPVDRTEPNLQLRNNKGNHWRAANKLAGQLTLAGVYALEVTYIWYIYNLQYFVFFLTLF